MSKQVNVVDYGADPTGMKDSAEAIRAAIRDCPDGGIVYLPEGTYTALETQDEA